MFEEVPMAVYLAWCRAKQCEYCRDRDLDAAENATCHQDYEFFTERADNFNDELIALVRPTYC